MADPKTMPTPAQFAKRRRAKEARREMRCSYCSCHLRGDRRKFALAGYYKLCARCEKTKVQSL